jgi:hypothetical protein
LACAFSWWLLGGLSGRFPVYTLFWGGLLARGPFNQVTFTCLPLIRWSLPPFDWWYGLHAWDSRWQPFLGWGDVAWTIEVEFVTSFVLIYLP